MEAIGIPNEDGDIVLQPVPLRIRVSLLSQEDMVLDMYTGVPYMIREGVWRDHRVEVGDYVGGPGQYRPRHWLLQYPTLWKRVN